MKIYTTSEAARRLNLSESQTRRLAKDLAIAKIGKNYAFTDSSIAALQRYAETRRVAQVEIKSRNINRPAHVPFNSPLAPSPTSANYRPSAPYRSASTPRTAGDVRVALRNITEARERSAAANRREARRGA